MNRQPHADTRESIVANALGEVVGELRLVDVADYIAFIRLEHFACLSDLVDSAAELYFMPGTLRLGHGGEAHVDWGGSPRIVLDLELRPRGVTVYFQLTLTAAGAVSGGFWGTLIGMIFLNPLLGLAVGASAGAVSGALADVGVNDQFMKDLAAPLQPNSSALFVLVRKATPDKVLAELAGTGGKVLKTSLSHEDEAKLQTALSGPKQ